MFFSLHLRSTLSPLRIHRAFLSAVIATFLLPSVIFRRSQSRKRLPWSPNFCLFRRHFHTRSLIARILSTVRAADSQSLCDFCPKKLVQMSSCQMIHPRARNLWSRTPFLVRSFDRRRKISLQIASAARLRGKKKFLLSVTRLRVCVFA